MSKRAASRSKNPLPTEAQSRTLRLIAQSGGILMLTHSEEGDRYADALGRTIPAPTALKLIRNGWVEPQRDSLFDLRSQSWRVKSAL